MKHIKGFKFNESVTTFNSLTDDELKERLKWLIIERDEIDNDINSINSIIKNRISNIDEIYAKSLPNSIFDFNKEQLDWILVNNNFVSQVRYNTSTKYFRELKGLYTNGYNTVTNQFKFIISTSSFNRSPNMAVKSIKLIGDNLKRDDGLGYVVFDIEFNNILNEDCYIKYYSSDKIKFNNHSKVYNSIEEILEHLNSMDIEEDDY